MKEKTYERMFAVPLNVTMSRMKRVDRNPFVNQMTTWLIVIEDKLYCLKFIVKHCKQNYIFSNIAKLLKNKKTNEKRIFQAAVRMQNVTADASLIL